MHRYTGMFNALFLLSHFMLAGTTATTDTAPTAGAGAGAGVLRLTRKGMRVLHRWSVNVVEKRRAELSWAKRSGRRQLRYFRD